MSDSMARKTGGDHLHLAARIVISAIPGIGGPALELFNATIAPSIERRRNDWLNELAQRLSMLEQEKRLKIEDLGENDEFISAVMQATMIAVRNHHYEKIDALRNAVVNSALDRCPSDVKSALFLAFVDQFTVWHLRVLKELSELALAQGPNGSPKTRIEAISEVVIKRIAELPVQQDLVEMVVEDLCRKGLLFWSRGQGVTFITRETSQITQLGEEFLSYVSRPNDTVGL